QRRPGDPQLDLGARRGARRQGGHSRLRAGEGVADRLRCGMDAALRLTIYAGGSMRRRSAILAVLVMVLVPVLWTAVARGHGGGIGLMEILVIGGLIVLAVTFMRRRQQQSQPAAPSGYAAPDDARNWAETPAQYRGTGPSTLEAPVDLERGLANIRQMDPDF